jgi:hypothetical protein
MNLKRLLPDSIVKKRYVSNGAFFGDAVSYLYLGESGNMKQLLKAWGRWENEWAKRGYRTISLDRFVELGGYGKPIDDVLGQRRDEGEEPVFHAQIYRENFLGKIKPPLEIGEVIVEMMRRPVSGTFVRPSTEHRRR